jgi:hypothetical protein
MSVRFVTNLLVALAGGFIVVASQAFTAAVTGWVTFGVALGVILVLAASQIQERRGLGLATLGAAVAVWSVVASVVYTGSTLTWLSFAEGLGLLGVAVAGLVAHELSTERVVHTIDVERNSRQYATAA